MSQHGTKRWWKLLPSPLLSTSISCLFSFTTTLLLSSLPISSLTTLGLLGISITRKSRKPHYGSLHCGLCPCLLEPWEAGGPAGTPLQNSPLVSPSFTDAFPLTLPKFHPRPLSFLLITFSLNNLLYLHDFNYYLSIPQRPPLSSAQICPNDCRMSHSHVTLSTP